MKKFSLLLLDANVIIELCRLGLWGRVLQKCEILLARTVFEESFFYTNDLGDEVYFSLDDDEKAGRLKVVEVPTADVLDFKSQFNELFGGDIDPGEAESLAYVFSQQAEHRICSADKIVYRVLGCRGQGEQGISLEEILKECGLTKKLPKQFGVAYKEHWTSFGMAEMLQGRAFRRK